MDNRKDFNKLTSTQLDNQLIDDIQEGKKIDFNGAPSDFFMQYLKFLRRVKRIPLVIDPGYIREYVDGRLYNFGPRAGQNITAKKIVKTESSLPDESGTRKMTFLMTVRINARYKSMGADREFTIPVVLSLSPSDNEEWDYGFDFNEKDIRNAILENQAIQEEITAPSKAVVDKIHKVTVKRPASGGGPGTGKKA